MNRSLRRMTMAVALVLGAGVAGAAQQADPGPVPAVPDAQVLLQFYPMALSTTPNGMVEDQAVWLAKVQGLMVGVPPMLQQSLLMSRTKAEFAANVALLQQMQESALTQRELQIRRLYQQGQLKK